MNIKVGKVERQKANRIKTTFSRKVHEFVAAKLLLLFFAFFLSYIEHVLFASMVVLKETHALLLIAGIKLRCSLQTLLRSAN